MKYIFPFVLFLLFQMAKGQDRLILFAGDTMNVKVLNITDRDINYRLPGDASGTFKSIEKSEVYRIKYENNTTLTFWAPPEKLYKKDSVLAAPDPHLMFMRGIEDADAHYKRNKGTFAGCFVGGFTLAIFSFVPPLVCANCEIPDRGLAYPDPRLMANADYRRGYTGEAKHKKLKSAWIGFATGLGSAILCGVIGGIVYSSYTIHH